MWYLSQVLHSVMYTVHRFCTDKGEQAWYNIQICIQRTVYKQSSVIKEMFCTFVQLFFAQIITLLLYSLYI